MANKYTPDVLGGVEKHVQTLLRHLSDSEQVCGVTVVGFSPQVAAMTAETAGSITVIRLPFWSKLGSAPLGWGMARLFKQLTYDILHLHVPSGVPEFAYMGSPVSQPLVVTYHAPVTRPALLGHLYSVVQSRLLRHASRIIVTSPQAKERHHLAVHGDRVQVIPLGIDPAPFLAASEQPEYQKTLKDRLGLQEGLVLLFVGRLVPYKGLDVLIRALPRVSRVAHEKVHCVIVGDGEERQRLSRKVADLGLKGTVHFVGSVSDNDLPHYYAISDVFVLPSVTSAEMFGLVQLEAHFSGLPVISTALPTGVPFVNADGETGLTVEPGASDALGDAIVRLANDEELRLRLGQQARQRAQRLFTAAHMTERTLEIYRSVLDRDPDW